LNLTESLGLVAVLGFQFAELPECGEVWGCLYDLAATGVKVLLTHSPPDLISSFR
jgi:hypothetical protein